ncbi:hypothetical protein Amet_1751 [Alkaliphilus metalliredigens QYMF]|uniref:Uncharacterized protein n=2 Tax=Alkaliphilus TaxID=114627 RepID=A6TP06_ALKMQ|nr:hypothetical protein Amet_1751 [Alkaliphilus metalliredigens QYMF]
MVDVKKELIDLQVREGDALFLKRDIYYRDDEETKSRKKEIQDRFLDTWKD